MHCGVEETKGEDVFPKNTIESQDIVRVGSNNDIEMKTNDNPVDTGTHYYGETVSENVPLSTLLDFITDIFIQSQKGNLPKTTPEETAALLARWFDKSILEDVKSEFYEQSASTIESCAGQFVRNILKRPRLDSDV